LGILEAFREKVKLRNPEKGRENNEQNAKIKINIFSALSFSHVLSSVRRDGAWPIRDCLLLFVRVSTPYLCSPLARARHSTLVLFGVRLSGMHAGKSDDIVRLSYISANGRQNAGKWKRRREKFVLILAFCSLFSLPFS